MHPMTEHHATRHIYNTSIGLVCMSEDEYESYLEAREDLNMPRIDESVFQAPGSHIVGNVEIGANSSVWYNAVIRAEEEYVEIGKDSNVQDNVVIHTDEGFPVIIGDGVSIGHSAIVHGCKVDDNTVIGMGAIVMNGAQVGRDCIIGAGALVTQGTIIPDGSIAFGNPAKVRRTCSEEEIERNRRNSSVYVELAKKARAEA